MDLPKTSDLIFPEASQNFSRTLLSLKRSRLSIGKRISSILEDSSFAQRVAAANGLPLVANERCGSWYIPHEAKAGSVYFKSTDGHQGQWQFSLRRLNRGLLALAGERGGCVVVDSTRRGKSMPDALSKTVPIWCAVMNRALFPDFPDSHELVVSPEAVSDSEASQISSRLDAFHESLKTLGLDVAQLRDELAGRPMRPSFVSQGDGVVKFVQDPRFVNIICCSASRRERGDNDSYIQGAGDDNENWSRGLTAELFWRHMNALDPRLDDEKLAIRIDNIVEQSKLSLGSGNCHQIRSIDGMGLECDICDTKFLSAVLRQEPNRSTLGFQKYDLLVTCDLKSGYSDMNFIAGSQVHFKCTSGKQGSKDLRQELEKAAPKLRELMGRGACRILCACQTSTDLSVAIALVIQCLFESKNGERCRVDKSFIRQRLALITAQFPEANPSRASLQSVNAFLMRDNGRIRPA